MSSASGEQERGQGDQRAARIEKHPNLATSARYLAPEAFERRDAVSRATALGPGSKDANASRKWPGRHDREATQPRPGLRAIDCHAR